MFYLKYRPQKFNDLFGLESIATTLKNQLKSGKVGHAYLFYGPRGTGKTSTARLLARAVNCERNSDKANKENKATEWDGEPCNECASCQSSLAGRFLDTIEIDAASHGLVDDIRDLRDKINLAPIVGRYKIYILDEAQMLLTSAANALLKTLEEPPAHAIFILCTTEPQKIPETIRSRCQRFEFRRAGSEDLRRKLKFIAEKEGFSVEESVLQQIVRQAQGGFRDAETFLEQFLVGEREQKTGELREEGPAAFLQLLQGTDLREPLLFLQKLYGGGQNLGDFVRETLFYLRDLLLLQAGLPEELNERSEAEIEEMSKLSTLYDRKDLLSLMEKIEEAGQQLKWSPVPQLPLEVVVLEWTGRERNEQSSDRVIEPASPPLAEWSGSKAEDKKKGVVVAGSGAWAQILQAVKPLNHSLAALLRAGRLISITEGKIEIEVFYPFHLERLREPRNRQLLEQAVGEALGRKVDVICRLAGEKA